MKKALDKDSEDLDSMEFQVNEKQVNEVLTTSVKFHETTTTEAGTTAGHSQREQEKKEILSLAGSIVEKIKQIDMLLLTSSSDKIDVGKMKTRLRLISTQNSGMIGAVTKMTNLNDDRQFSALITVRLSLFI